MNPTKNRTALLFIAQELTEEALRWPRRTDERAQLHETAKQLSRVAHDTLTTASPDFMLAYGLETLVAYATKRAFS